MLASLISCQKDDNQCGGGVYQVKIDKYLFTSIFKMDDSLKFHHLDTDSLNFHLGDTIYFNFRMSFQSVKYSSSGNILMACTPIRKEVLDLGDSLRIESIYAFDNKHPVNADVSEYFFLFNENYIYQGTASAYLPLNLFNMNNGNFNNLILGLIKKPESNQAKFRLIIHDKITKQEYAYETSDIIYR